MDIVIPDFPLSVRRLSPAPGYLEALCADNVGARFLNVAGAGMLTCETISPIQQCDFTNDRITRVTPTGIEFEGGKSIDLDVIICATGESSYPSLSVPGHYLWNGQS